MSVNGVRDAGLQVSYEEVQLATTYLRQQLDSSSISPKIGIICGTGWQDVAEIVQGGVVFPYNEIPGFPVPTVSGHAGRLIFGSIHGQCVVVMQGRVHMYEGYSMARVTLPIRVMHALGVKLLLASNAAGGLNPTYKIGDLMVMRDHIYFPSLAGHSPLLGPNDSRLGPRFPAMSRAYDDKLIKLARRVAGDLHITDVVKEGVYFMGAGPQYESVAEARMLRLLGADSAGMSTAPEVVVATHCGMSCFGLTLISNMVVMEYETAGTANHSEVLEVGEKMAPKMRALLEGMIKAIDMSDYDG